MKKKKKRVGKKVDLVVTMLLYVKWNDQKLLLHLLCYLISFNTVRMYLYFVSLSVVIEDKNVCELSSSTSNKATVKHQLHLDIRH